MLPAVADLPLQTVTSCLSVRSNLVQSPKDAVDLFFPKARRHLRPCVEYEILQHEITSSELNTVAEFGRFPYRPSELFLKLFHNAICTVRRDPFAGCVSPSLIGSSGVVPFSIISTIPDIMNHYYRCIVKAKKEVLLATNYWEKSSSVDMIVKALRELSKRAVQDNRQLIVKIIIDHPTKENLLNHHSILCESKWADYGIPPAAEFPNVSLEINNFHRLIFGTFHSKFLIIDRRIALINSNNMQDRPNLEMMSHFEGDIVNGFYDTFLISWWSAFQPELTCLNDPAPVEKNFEFGMNNSRIFSLKQPLKEIIARARLRLASNLEEEDSSVDGSNSHADRLSNIVSSILNHHRDNHSTQMLVKATTQLAGAPVAYDLNPRTQSPLTHRLNQSATTAHGTVSEQTLTEDELDRLASDFTPLIFHSSHSPVPIALVNRPPYGKPIHKDTANPQDAVWMGAFRYAEKSIFIQSPTLNATPAIDGIIDACQRGIFVTLWLGLGFNDSLEGTGTFQGGTNEQVVKKLYQKLRENHNGSEQYLKVFWYTGKDQKRPLHFTQKKRNCHIKFMSIDDQVGIMGSGNMDTQSWFHSQEINVMIDSPLIVKEWMDALQKNQATGDYGQVDIDGVWRDSQGNVNPKNGK